MKHFIPLDIKEYCNHRLIYNELPSKAEIEFGLDNICILESDFKFKAQDVVENVEFKFCLGVFDNIVCDSQKIKINAVAKRIHLLCFGYWGDTNEPFKIIYEDLSEEIVWIPFIDWAHMAYCDSRNIAWRGNVSTEQAGVTSGALSHPVYFHYYTCQLTQNKIVKEIILPDNIFTHIFAMTLENESEDIEIKNQED